MEKLKEFTKKDAEKIYQLLGNLKTFHVYDPDYSGVFELSIKISIGTEKFTCFISGYGNNDVLDIVSKNFTYSSRVEFIEKFMEAMKEMNFYHKNWEYDLI